MFTHRTQYMKPYVSTSTIEVETHNYPVITSVPCSAKHLKIAASRNLASSFHKQNVADLQDKPIYVVPYQAESILMMQLLPRQITKAGDVKVTKP